jgi:hypothetical protein
MNMATAHTNRLTAGAIQPVAKPEPAASTALKPIEPGDLNEVMTFAQVAVRTGTFGLKNIEEAAFRILYGRELGMSVFQSIMGIDIIQNRPGLKAGTVASLIQRSGRYEYRVGEWDHLKCVIEFFDNGMVLGSSTFTIDDAKRAQVYKEGSNWSKYPKAMLFARAITQGARAYCPSIFFGPIYSSEELADGGGDVIDVQIAEPEVVAAEPVVEAKPAKAAKKPAKPVEPVVEAEPVVDAPFDDQPQADTVPEKVRKLDEWSERVAKRFDEKGQASFASGGAVIEEMYRRFAEIGFVPHGATTYRARTQAIASIEATWAEILDNLKNFTVQLAAELEAPPAEENEPGSDG